MVTGAVEHPALRKTVDKVRSLMHYPPAYGAMDNNLTGDTCPTCLGTGRIPQGQENHLVAVIPCNDRRLKPSRTKLYVCISIVICLLVCCLVLFFLFPRSVTLTPVSLLSAMVFFTDKTVEMEITNAINITNGNFVPVQIMHFSLQGLISNTIVGKSSFNNTSMISSRSQRMYTIQTKLSITDPDLNTYCKASFKVHTIFLVLQMTMNISYLSHTEQLSLDTFEYIDCGTNSTVPHPISRSVIQTA